jgi:signal transduction histidine kinase
MPLRSVGARLSLALLLVVASALGIVYLLLVPSLERRLTNAKIAELARAAPSVARRLPAIPSEWDLYAQDEAASTDARVVIFQYFPSPPSVSPFADSHGNKSSDVESDPIALRAGLTQRPARGTVERSDDRVAEVAVPASPQVVVLLAASLHDSLANVHLVQRRLLLGGGIALLVALTLGYGGAWAFARRIRRLERAAERIAGGVFDEPVVDSSADELGQLARAFDRMRGRLAQLDGARREFIANASHELRTPLFSLGGFLELLADEEVDEATRREFLAAMREQVDRLTKLATDLLDLSRVDAGRLRIEQEPVDLGDVAAVVAEEFRPLALRSEHPLDLVDEGATALGDRVRLEQVARILVQNALRHTPPGTRVRVRVTGDGGRARLVVEDDGPGVADEHARQVFERFYRIDGALASGSGLGLAIARELIQLMGGTIELDSRPGFTAFAVTLPGVAGSPSRF